MQTLDWMCEVPRLPGHSRQECQAIKREAEEGNPVALYLVGKAYLRGEGLRKDTARGARLLMQSAQRGFSPAQQLLDMAGLSATPLRASA